MAASSPQTPCVTINPATGRRIRAYRPHSPAQAEAALARAHRAFLAWGPLAPARRLPPIRALGRVLRSEIDALAALATEEMGKPIVQARAEVEKSAKLCDFYAGHAPAFLEPEAPVGGPRGVHVRFEPLGAILAIMPWNYPYWQVVRAAVPALAAGNTVLLKHAPNVSGCALALHDLFAAAGFPAGAFQTLLLPNERIPAVIDDPRVQGVTLTGSARAGRAVGALAGRAMKKAVFELGGSDPYLVLADADVALAAAAGAESRLLNSGQSCICAKRFLVVPSVRREFEETFTAAVAARSVGDPREPSTEVGPLARADLRDHLDDQVQASVAAGARVLLGGRPLPGPGCFYAPTVLTGVRAGMPAYDEELFGPVAAIIPVRDEAAAIATANASPYGLGAGVFSRDPRRALRVAGRLQAGAVAINDFVRSDPAVPFGGVKLSGHGRELGSWGLREFVNVKAVAALH